ncbi:hypothetical protein PENARI_c016G05715 [Penicillium arizonense]|uniref:Uncharacterized protein n=1 Tax=Penicillium arizonense TaxID=1835702 RepID=A0A1F5LC36_PENAI|nr:hypothetical protein PENARI_c016G05715 [Penicillium arizonense]OGE50499.1 hypothetical protein PENARI_c016G05715 [Penicillium arizonense]
MTSVRTCQDRLSQPPVELLVIIFQQCTDFNERACDIVSTILTTRY